jgi:DNA-binding transcriptional MerR regulator
MTNGDHLTLAQLAEAVGMTARNVRAYQTRGLLQPPRRAGRNSLYGDEHVRRLLQVKQARARGASLALLRTLIREGRDLEGVWANPRAGVDRAVDGAPDQALDQGADQAADRGSGQPLVVDLTSPSGGHTAECLARRDVPLATLLARLTTEAADDLAGAVRALVEAGVFAGEDGDVRVPGSFACAAAALADQGQLATAAAVRLAAGVTDAARSIAVLVAATARTVDDEGRRSAADRLGELAAAVVGQLAGREVLVMGEAGQGEIAAGETPV